jgi:hypothetical protein
MTEELISDVLEQIKADFEVGDHTAICELLSSCLVHNLIAFLPEEKWAKFESLAQDPSLR